MIKGGEVHSVETQAEGRPTSHARQGEMHEIPSHCSEWHTTQNHELFTFGIIFHLIFLGSRKLKTADRQTADKGLLQPLSICDTV